MLDITWTKRVIDDPLTLADYMELVAALAPNPTNEAFTPSYFIDDIEEELSSSASENSEVRLDVEDLHNKLESAIDLMKSRQKWLGELYPFEASSEGVLLSQSSIRKTDLPYIYLLVCSHLSTIPKLTRYLREDFENICKEAMRTIFNSSEVILFSQFSEDRRELGWSARLAIPALAKKLNTVLKNESDIPNTQAEFGIDIIAIHPFGDNLSYPFFTFAQCTVSKEWWTKKDEAQAQRFLKAYIELEVEHTNLLFIPQLPRTADGKWSEPPHKRINCVICDRFRICKMLDYASQCGAQDSKEEIDRILAQFSSCVGIS